MVVTSAGLTSAAGHIITANAPVHWLLGPTAMVSNASAVTPQFHCPSLEAPSFGTYWKMAESAGVPTAGGPVDNVRETVDRDLPVRPCHNPGTMYPVGARPDVTNPPSDWNPP
ncbi:hypothetical protein NDU88_003582 [Pleurodeles waltl]|uniref:Uncharacterized protein n=1 Tax=Pleurodeles waltl TaxID=8319 RepID=A0AAV7UCH4_PLEWA|nr:hypothetical protein NDU88_003582 [Pleurodeles waltl]